MKSAIQPILIGSLLTLLWVNSAAGRAFTEPGVTFYGEVRMVGGGGTVLLQAGHLRMTFVNLADAANRVELETELRPTGTSAAKPFSYSLRVPLAYLPAATRKTEFLSVSSLVTDFQIEQIEVDGVPATLPDGSRDFYTLSSASRSGEYRLDLLVAGESTDSDGDGMPDWWEESHGLNPELAADASLDSDGDGWSNLEEFRRGGNPGLSNTTPQLVSTEVVVPEMGTAGLLPQLLDSDSTAGEIVFSFSTLTPGGFVLQAPEDGNPISLADLQAGAVTLRHTDRAVREVVLQVSWTDGGDSQAGQLHLRVATASSEAGDDASLWLDGHDLPAGGSSIGSWHDRSGNDHNAMQPLPTHQPVVMGRTADFSTGETAHLFFRDTAIPASDHTSFAVYRAAGSSKTNQTLLASNRGHLHIAATSEAISYPGAPIYQMDGLAVGGYEGTGGAISTSIFRNESDHLQSIFGLSFDGENIAIAAIDPVLPTLGARRPAAPTADEVITEPFGGQLHEMLVFPTALPEQKLRDVHDYLQSKWSGTVIWNNSTRLRSVQLVAGGGARHIIRGGHGADALGGGPLDDTISGGPGADSMAGGGGSDRFVFGHVDSGRDLITDFDPDEDTIDLSAHFWGERGDARQFISVRLDTNFSTPIPTLDSVLLVHRSDGDVQEIVLRDQVIGATQLVQLIVEGRIRMGGLSIPSAVQLALAGEASQQPRRELDGGSYEIEVVRSGDGAAAALDVPIGLFADALGKDLVIEGANDSEGQRAVVSFGRGETSKSLTVHPVADLETEGEEIWQIAALPHFRYSVVGDAVGQRVSDTPKVWLEVVEANAVASSDSTQPARVRVRRDGALAQSLNVQLEVGGSALPGVHLASVPDNVTIAAGQDFAEIQINAIPGSLTDGVKIAVLRLGGSGSYLVGNPHEALIYAANTEDEAENVGFDHWLDEASAGEFTTLDQIVRSAPREAQRYFHAYASGLDSPGDPTPTRIDLRIVDGKPELTADGIRPAIDVQWGVRASTDLDGWADGGSTFVEVPDANGLKLIGAPLAPGETQKYYRLEFGLDPDHQAGSGIAALTGATRFGLTGDARWSGDLGDRILRSTGGTAGTKNRIIAEVSGKSTIGFEMEISGAETGDRLAFFIDGKQITATTGNLVNVQEELTDTGAHLLMWEFRGAGGEAVIRFP